MQQGRYASLRQAQLELRPFDAERLQSVAVALRELYPTGDRPRMEELVSTAFIELLVKEVTRGFKGDVGVVPRQFLREFVTQLDLVDEHAEYSPMQEYGFEAKELSPQEQWAVDGEPPPPDTLDEAELVPKVDVW
jgi:hypothetical protein